MCLRAYTVYMHAIHTRDVPYDICELQDEIRNGIKAGGFSVVRELEIQETLIEKQDLVCTPSTVFEVFHETFSKQLLAVSEEASLVLPQRLVVYKKGGGSCVSLLKIGHLFEGHEDPEIQKKAQLLEDLLISALEEL